MSEQSCEGTGLWGYFTLRFDRDSRIGHPWMRHDELNKLECEMWIVDRPKGMRYRPGSRQFLGLAPFSGYGCPDPCL